MGRLTEHRHVRRVPGGATSVRLGVFLLGLAFILIGLALSVLPGPFTLPPVLLGLFLWSLEFAFAERWLATIKDQAEQAWAGAKARPWRAAGSLALSLTALVAALFAARRFEVVERMGGLVG